MNAEERPREGAPHDLAGHDEDRHQEYPEGETPGRIVQLLPAAGWLLTWRHRNQEDIENLDVPPRQRRRVAAFALIEHADGSQSVEPLTDDYTNLVTVEDAWGGHQPRMSLLHIDQAACRCGKSWSPHPQDETYCTMCGGYSAAP